MTPRWFIASVSTAALAMLLSAPAARAKDFCVLDAKVELKDCKTGCTEDFQVAKDDCFNRDHACMEVCRARREECRLATGIDADFAACRATLQGAKQRCRDTNPAGSPELDQCIDQAQVVAFQCRDDARERARRALKACRRAFRACAMACPPADPNAPPVDIAACRSEARQDFTTCRANCIEDFQVAKDACHNRDHACVEQCRAQRDACRDPVLARLESDIAQCNADRDHAIQLCRDAYGAGTPELNHCIDNAQVDAFRCRDAARERARPQLMSCRAAFGSCVRACPPASPSGAFLGGGT
jgi:hypothetical protein